MKILFLDIDGVLNSEGYVKTCGHYGVIIDPSKMDLIKKIADSTDAKIVLTTSWRKFWEESESECHETGKEIIRIFRERGLEIYSKTPSLSEGREAEIKAWLDTRKNISTFAVIDDMFLYADFLKDNFVKTSKYLAIRQEEAEKAIEILNR